VYAVTRGGYALAGAVAKAQAASNPEGTIFSIKRRMGTDYRAHVHESSYSPQEISSFILRKIKSDAEHAIGRSLNRAIITVPAYFSDAQRQATREAGRMAGLQVVRMINEPTAAALAYGLDKEGVQNILVWDLGGGTFDVSILEMGDGVFHVRAVNGDTFLGGDDWDVPLVSYAASAFQRESGFDPMQDRGVMTRLRFACEKAKRELSVSDDTNIRLSIKENGRRSSTCFSCPITRETFESMTGNLRNRLKGPTRRALVDAGLAPKDIDRIILVGGATRMPAIRTLVREIFAKDPYISINPDEVVAIGAAIQGGVLSGAINRVVLVDVVPLSIGIETQGGIFSRIIPRNTTVPVSADCIVTNAQDDQPEMDIHVLQGEREMACDNISLGRFLLADIPPLPRGKAQVEVTFEIDVSGVVKVTAREIYTGVEARVRIDASHLLPEDQIEARVREAVVQAASDRERRKTAEASIQAGVLLDAGKAFLDKKRFPTDERDTIQWALFDLENALAEGDIAGLEENMETLRGFLHNY
jgi:molecular chaperone DnaK